MSNFTLPKNGLKRIDLGQTFAEYDLLRKDPHLFVETPSTLAALSADNTKCFFVGRRGSGKTAIALTVEKKFQRTVSLLPQFFDLLHLPLEFEEFIDTRKRPFKSLMHTMERALLCELVKHWIAAKRFSFEDSEEVFKKERNLIEGLDFDQRVLSLTKEIFDAYSSDNEKLWLRQIGRSKELITEIQKYSDDGNFQFYFLIDRLDESWDGSESALISLMALMHASVRLRAMCECIRPYIFIRENIFDRIRSIDNEFARLETSVVFLEWSVPKLTELVERRLVQPFTAKPKLGGEAWGYFFNTKNTQESIEGVMSLCQKRPRDVLMFCSFAIESAVNEGHSTIEESDVEAARKRYSTSRLKDLGDEYAENFPNISVVIELFYGLGTEFTSPAIEDFIKKLLLEDSIKKYCREWFYQFTAPYQFVGLLYSIGFLGLKRKGKVHYKEAGKDSNAKPYIELDTTFVVHPTYHDALNLRNLVLHDLSQSTILRNEGVLEDLPDSFTFDAYKSALKDALERLKSLPTGNTCASEFEDIVGEILKLCFFRSLGNVQSKARTHDGAAIRDWIVSNRADSGFWQHVRDKYGATQVVWECKNYEVLKAEDFYQVQSYMSSTFGHFGVIAFRGNDVKDSYLRQISSVANKNQGGMILLLTQKDLEVFLRQAINGTFKEAHIQDRYDYFIRQIS